MDIDQLIEEIKLNAEYLETSEEDDVECISLENLEAILCKHLKIIIKLSDNE